MASWHPEARKLLQILGQDDLSALHNVYWRREQQPSSSAELIEEILTKESKPSKLLSRQQITVDVMKRYLAVTKGTYLSALCVCSSKRW